MSSLSKRMVALAAFVLVVAVAFVFSAQKARSASSSASPKSATHALQQGATVSGTLSGLLIDLETGQEVQHTMDVAEVSPTRRYGLLFGQDYALNITVTVPNGVRTAAFGSFATGNVFHVVTSSTSTTFLQFDNVVLSGRLLAEGNVGFAVTSALLPNATTMAVLLAAQGGTAIVPPSLPDKPQPRGSCSGRNHGEAVSSSKIIVGGNVDACPGPTTVTAAAVTGWRISGNEPDEVVEASCTDVLPSTPPQQSVFLSHSVSGKKDVNVSWRQQVNTEERKVTIGYYRQSDNHYTGQKRFTYHVEFRGTPELVVTAGEACPADPGPADPAPPIP